MPISSPSYMYQVVWVKLYQYQATSINTKIKVIGRLEFELAYFEAADVHLHHRDSYLF